MASDFDREWAASQARQHAELVDAIIGPGPFYCSDCGKQMIEAGHLMTSFFLCPDAGEFTPGPPKLRVVLDGVSYWTDPRRSADELAQAREYFKQSRDAHERAHERPGIRQYTG
jgi:hypothetical protein